jgi:hypothetical protein
MERRNRHQALKGEHLIQRQKDDNCPTRRDRVPDAATHHSLHST